MQFPDQPQKLQLATRNHTQVSNPHLAPQGPGLDIGDIYFTLFRHKWKIILCSLLGLTAAVGQYKLRPPPYQSESKLFIRYVMDSRAAAPAGDEARVKSIDTGETIISSELEIMTSLDLAGQVVDTLGPEKIIVPLHDGHDRERAINVVSKGLSAEAAPRSSVVHLIFRNGNQTIVQPVLREIIDRYLKKHVEIHRALGISGDFLNQETDRLRSRLAQTHEELREAENKVGVASIEEAKKSYADQISKLRQEIYTAEAEFAERSMVFKELTGKSAHVEAPEKTSTPPPSQEQIDEYRKVSERLTLLRHKEQELLTQFTEENSRVKELRVQLDEAVKAKQKIEEETPGLKSFEVARPTMNPATPVVTAIDVNGESARLKALETKIQTFQKQLEETRAEAAKVSQMEATIQELRRKKDLEEANYKYYSGSLEQARIDEALGAGHVSNISEIQSPSPPTRDRSKSLKLLLALAVGGVAGGLGWAFAIEMLFDRTVKRPIDVERISKLPLFISVPRISASERRRFAKQQSLAQTAIDKADEDKKGKSSEQLAKVGPSRHAPSQLLYHFHETLRDRLVAYFESINLTHKPKLVAVTGLSRSSGVTTVAAGLAQCLSETGEGNVLLVDMTAGQGSAQQFFKGQKICGIDELLHTRNNAQIQEKLYVVQEGSNSENLSRNLPQRFTKLVPKLKASDFDYIIFDMPPVSQISVTPRLASFMDMVLMVIESEKTDSDVIQRASALLAQSKTNVGVVLNKTRSYIPKMLYNDSLSDI